MYTSTSCSFLEASLQIICRTRDLSLVYILDTSKIKYPKSTPATAESNPMDTEPSQFVAQEFFVQEQATQPQLLAPVAASVLRYRLANDKYWYIVECQLDGGSKWELSRYYQNFYDLQIKLLKEFPAEANTDGNGTRILLYMPGPVTYVTDAISNRRRQALVEYVKILIGLPPYISRCDLVREFFAPREGDHEIDLGSTSPETSSPVQAASQHLYASDGVYHLPYHLQTPASLQQYLESDGETEDTSLVDSMHISLTFEREAEHQDADVASSATSRSQDAASISGDTLSQGPGTSQNNPIVRADYQLRKFRAP